jgi:DnaJ-class molecular chaperone
MDLELRRLLDELFDNLESTDYYALLGVSRDANAETLRRAFYRRAEIMHPDRHYNIVDSDLREKLYVVYKRVAEAYRVLGGEETRREYDLQLARGQARYQPDTFKDIPREPEATIRNLRARKLFMDAKTAIREQNLQGAFLALKMAESLEPNNSVIQDLILEVTGGRR